MTPTLPSVLLPGGWVTQAQSALDDLAAMRTLDEVEARFGSARNLCETVLGFPISGGHATRRAIRATGLLLRHRLGPALAAEALSWAASVSTLVDAATVETLLEAASTAEATYLPLRLDERHLLEAHLGRVRLPAQRRRRALDLWRSHERERWLPDWLAMPPWRFHDDEHDEVELVAWLSRAPDSEGNTGPNPRHRLVLPAGLVDVAEQEQLGLFVQLDAGEREAVARSEVLFGLAGELVAACLAEHPGAVLANPSCPEALRRRVRHPYDEATLELAVRAGAGHYEVARVRRLLEGAGAALRSHLRASSPVEYAAARRCCGLLTLADLDGIDLADRRVAEVVLGRPRDWPGRRIPEVVVEALIEHPQAEHLVWVVERTDAVALRGEVVLRRLVDEAPAPVAAAALVKLDPAALQARDAELAGRLGRFWMARCPGIPASERPDRESLDLWAEAAGVDRDDVPFHYPPVVQALAGRDYPEAPGWSVSLPVTPSEVERNGKLMRNCTASFDAVITGGWCFLLIVHDPRGRRYNAEIYRDEGRYRVGQIDSFANGGIEPAWLRPALEARLAAPEHPPRRCRPDLPPRPRHDRRERRRARASSARRRWR